MPTYLNNSLGGYSSTDPNCRQIYEHVQGCPVCQQIFRTGGNAVNAVKQYHIMQQQRPPFVADRELPVSFASAASSAIEISPTVAFLVVVLIVLLLVYIIRNKS
jgi:predicted anti-sigma-YlaC factor YlaD